MRVRKAYSVYMRRTGKDFTKLYLTVGGVKKLAAEWTELVEISEQRCTFTMPATDVTVSSIQALTLDKQLLAKSGNTATAYEGKSYTYSFATETYGSLLAGRQLILQKVEAGEGVMLESCSNIAANAAVWLSETANKTFGFTVQLDENVLTDATATNAQLGMVSSTGNLVITICNADALSMPGEAGKFAFTSARRKAIRL